ncbi:phosphonate C-P lyase system protein PhnG [Psychromarinibacter sp. S121]|uniref:phosphonate C-P lyase system protein PhnG n=1 Tax=Psychromarinibacter sp. S121 TaxID=3415127 RepID=UPI003C79D16D
MLDHSTNGKADEAVRRHWMGLLARAPEGRVAALSADLPRAFDWLRAPEIGAVMVRGRAGGTGGPFNLGEMTVTRCSLKLADGTVGHGYVQGRRKADAEAAALVDALMQTDASDQVRAAVLDPLETEETGRRAARAAKAAATKVEFFTLVRGED